ncbi:MAG: chromosomal replication initiator protein DnaA [Rhodothermales bacterium]
MTARVQSVWSSCLERISDVIPKYSYNTWIRPLRPISLEDRDPQILRVEVPNVFHQKWVEENYIEIVYKSVREILGPQTTLQLSLPLGLDDRLPAPSKQEAPAGAKMPPAPPPLQVPFKPPVAQGMQHASQTSFTGQSRPGNMPQGLQQPVRPNIPVNNHRAPGNGITPPGAAPAQGAPNNRITSAALNLGEHHTFDEFVEGAGNRLSRSAAMAVAKEPGSTSFNPLFVYGDVGLGKTHLAQAICNYAIKNKTAKNPIYVTIDNFTNQFISAIRANRAHEFTNFYRKVDLLVVDDIQFLSGKERTQEEFFHLFNAIHQSGGQLVLCADRAPGDIQGIHNRLISRFHWGLTTDISAPDFETRVAILLQKSVRYKLSLNEEIAETIAQSVSRNVRELESVLTKILAHCSLHGTPITQNLTESILQHYGSVRNQVTMDEIIEIVSESFGTPSEYIVGKSRKREIVIARHAAMYLAKEFTHRSLKSIGLHFAGRDHSTVIHAVKAVADRIETEPSFRQKLEYAREIVRKRVEGSRTGSPRSN